MRLPPGPSQFGNLLLAPKLVRDPRGPITELTARYGLTWRGRIVDQRGVVDLVWMMGQAGNERVLAPRYKDHFSWYEGYSFSMEPLFGRDILFLLDDEVGASGASGASGAEGGGAHRQRQRLLVPAFHPRLDSAYLPEMAAIIGRYLDQVKPGEPLDLQWLIKRVTFHIVTQLLFGAEEQELARLTHLFEEVGLGLFALLRWDLPGLPFRRARRARQELARYIQGRIDWYRTTATPPPTMLGQLMQAQREANTDPGASGPLPDESLIAEMLAFLFAGYDTTSSMLTSLLVALGEDRKVLGELTDEVSQADGAQLRRGEVPEQPLLDAVLLETERLYPPLLFAMRGTRCAIEHDGYDIPARTKVAYSPYYTGRMPELFSEPHRFLPERFLDKKPPPYTLLGFGGGHRTCIGKRFAGLEMRLFLNLLLSRFELVPAPQDLTAVFFNPTLQRKHGYWATLRPRPGAGPAA